jgi:predicted transcriptional regulator
MHDQRSQARPPGAVPSAARSEVIERRVLLELITDPPPQGDDLAQLAARLDEPPLAVERAVTALERAGLALRDEDVVRATPAARRFDQLWPIRT